jgi:hypothetical protein
MNKLTKWFLFISIGLVAIFGHYLNYIYLSGIRDWQQSYVEWLLSFRMIPYHEAHTVITSPISVTLATQLLNTLKWMTWILIVFSLALSVMMKNIKADKKRHLILFD